MTARILVAEDERAIQLAIRGLLRRDGYEVELADTGEAAIRKIQETPLDLVLTDLALGQGPSGMDVLRFAKQHRPEAAVVMITAHGTEKLAVEAMKTAIGQSHLYPDGNAFYLKNKLAAKLNVTKPVITRALDAMGARKLVTRHRDPRDKRNVVISRTVEGSQYLERFADLIITKARDLPL